MMLRKGWRIFFVSVLVLFGVRPLCFADTIFHDDFDGSTLDPAWTVSFGGETTSWNYYLSDSWLYVDNVNDTHWDDGSADDTHTWGTVTLTRSLSQPVTGRFKMDARIHWNYFYLNNKPPMQYQHILLCDASGNIVAGVGDHDQWCDKLGTKWATIGENTTNYDPNVLGQNGYAYLRITRQSNNNVSIYFSSNPSFSPDKIILTGTASDTITQVIIQYGFFGWDGSGGPSRFQDEDIDYITIVPEPTSLMLLGLGLTGLLGIKNRKRR